MATNHQQTSKLKHKFDLFRFQVNIQATSKTRFLHKTCTFSILATYIYMVRVQPKVTAWMMLVKSQRRCLLKPKSCWLIQHKNAPATRFQSQRLWFVWELRSIPQSTGLSITNFPTRMVNWGIYTIFRHSQLAARIGQEVGWEVETKKLYVDKVSRYTSKKIYWPHQLTLYGIWHILTLSDV